jgi:hypothetical protein
MGTDQDPGVPRPSFILSFHLPILRHHVVRKRDPPQRRAVLSLSLCELNRPRMVRHSPGG